MGRHYLKTKVDMFAFLVFILGGLLDLAYESLVITHYEWKGYKTSYAYRAFLAFSAIQIYWNLYFVTTVSNKVTEEAEESAENSPTETPGESQTTNPAGSHHCKRCDDRILIRDHHCWFAGNCIGKNNRRYFFVMAVYLWIVAYVENIYNLQFVCDILGCGIISIITICIPHFPILLRNFNGFTLGVNLMTFLGLLLFVAFSILLYFQIGQLVSGQTSYERKKGVKKPLTPSSMYKNVKDVLGDRWYLPFVCPLFGPKVKSHTE